MGNKSEKFAKIFCVCSLILLFVVVIIFGIVLKSNSDNGKEVEDIKEYTMAEFSELLKPVYDEMKQKIEYLTDEEMQNLPENFLYQLALKHGLPVGERIILRGRVHNVWNTDNGIEVCISSEYADEDYDVINDTPIWCEFKNSPEVVFLEENETIAVEGIFLDEKSFSGVLINCKIVSPTIKIPEYKNNIKEVVDEATETDSDYFGDYTHFEMDIEAFGVIADIYDISAKNTKNEWKRILGNNKDISELIEEYDYVYLLTTDDEKYGIWIYCNSDTVFEIGDMIYAHIGILETNIVETENEKTFVIYMESNLIEKYYIYQ